MRYLFALALIAAQAWAQTGYSFTTFAVPGSGTTGASAIGENGDVTGIYTSPNPPYTYAGFLRKALGAITTISYPGATTTAAGGMNRFGVIAGSYNAGSSLGGFFNFKAAYKNAVVNGQPASLSDIDDYGDYVGVYFNPSFTGFLASPDGQVTTLQYPGGSATSPVWIKNSGKVIGRYQDHAGYSHAFVWQANSGYKTIYVPDMPGAQIADINSSGAMVGTYVSGGANHGFIYQNGRFEIVEPPGASASWIAAINSRGQAADNCIMPGASPGFIATPVP
jgi:hypothetical protein